MADTDRCPYCGCRCVPDVGTHIAYTPDCCHQQLDALITDSGHHSTDPTPGYGVHTVNTATREST